MRKLYMGIVLVIAGFFYNLLPAGAQSNALLWQISGKGLKQPSYLFGTNHLLTNRFLDSLPVILQKFDACKTLVCEAAFDSAAIKKLDAAMLISNKDSTLKDYLSAPDYAFISQKMQELMGVDLSPFSRYKPMTLNLLLYQFILQRYMPQPNYKERELGMDLYLQTLATRKNKIIQPLESTETQLEALYGQFSNVRQAEMLVEFVRNIDKNRVDILNLISCYKNQDIACLKNIMYSDTAYKASELDKLLYSRNRNWMMALPAQISKESTFIAVGAAHLTGEYGLIALLQKSGYTLTPLNLGK